MTWEDVKDESTENLIDYIQYKENADYRELAEAAFIAFTFRFRKEIIDRCRKVGEKWGYDADTADGIAEKTFERFWKYPLGFKKEKCGSLVFDNCVRLYLFRIVRNCFYDHNKELSETDNSPYDGTETVIVEFPGIDHLDIPRDKVEGLKKVQALMQAALDTLSPKHKVIYLTYKAYEKEGFKLPRNLLKQLRDELDLTQNSIRVYKKEAFETVEKHVKRHGKR